MKQMTYVGGQKCLKGKTALVRQDPHESLHKNGSPFVLAQFDDFGASLHGVSLAHGWHQFDKNEFAPIEAGEAE